MQYKNTGNEIIVRLDDGDEALESLRAICKNEGVESATITGIGAAREAEIGHWNPKGKKYDIRKVRGLLEIVSLNGNVTCLDDGPMIHLHIAVGMDDFSTISGHLISAEIYPTCEIVILPISAKITREKSEKIGLSLQKF